MAGLLVTLGSEALPDHERCLKEYTKAKDLSLSHQETLNNFSLTKFCRNNESDKNVLLSDDIAIWIIGTLIYRNLMGKAALIALKQDLAQNQIEDLVKHLDGPFCLIIKKPCENGFWIITDHAGILNLYQYKKGKIFAISTSSLALSRSFPVTQNTEGIVQFLRNATICDSKTIYNEIELFEPASIYYIEYEPHVNIKHRTKYWKNPIDVIEDISFEDAQNFFANSLLSGIEALAHENITCDLTAGHDSRLLLSSFLSAQNSREGNIHTFVFGPDGSTEVNLVKQYCENLGLRNNHLTLPPDWNEQFYEYVLKALLLTDGEESACVYAPILWAQEFKSKQYSCSVGGLGGELYRDFWWIQEILCRRKPANYERLINSRVLQYEYDYSIFSEDWKRELLQVKDIYKRKYLETNSDMEIFKTYNTLQIDNIYFRQKIRRWAGRTISTSNQLIRTVAPLTFKKCLEAGMSIPPRYKRNGRIVKAVVEKFSPVLAQQKMLNGTPCQNIRFDNFHKFIPLISDITKKGIRKISQRMFNRTILLDKTLTYQTSSWFNTMLSDMRAKKILSYHNMCTRKLYRKEQFERFVDDAQKPGFRFYNQLGNLLTLELRMKEDKLIDELDISGR